jgi:hypothetical protein
MSGVQMAVGHPLCSLSSRSSCPSWNLAYNSPCLRERERAVTLSLFYQLESVRSCSAHPETKFNVHFCPITKTVTTICTVQNLWHDWA